MINPVNLIIITCGIASLIVMMGMDSLLHSAKTESRRFLVGIIGIFALILLMSVSLYTKLHSGNVDPNAVESETSFSLVGNVLAISADS